MSELTLNFMGGRPAWLVILPVAVLAVVWWTYRSTYPPVSRPYRLLLILLRVAAVVLLGVFIFEPALLATRRVERKERVALVLDHSASMLLPATAAGGEGAPSRLERALEAARETGRKGDVALFAFGAGLVQLADSSDSNVMAVEDRTDLGSALLQLTRQSARAWDRVVVVTDGAVNSGPDPVSAVDSALVVEAVLTGESPEVPDLVLSGVELARPVYAGGRAEVDLAVSRAGKWAGGGAGATVCDFYLDGRKIAEQRIELAQTSARFVSARASFPAPEPGSYWLRAVLRPVEREWSTLNNERLVKLAVRKSKRRALFVSDRPDWDFTFSQRAVEAGEDWEVEAIMLLRGQDGITRARTRLADGAFREGRLPEAGELSEIELMVLHGRIDRLDGEFLRRVASAAARGGPALVFWPAGDVDFSRLPEQIARFMPFTAEGKPELVRAPDVPAVLFTLDRFGVLSAMGSGTQIEGLPPVQEIWRGLALKRNAEVLARLDRKTPGRTFDLPLIAACQTGGVRSAGFLAQGLWRWHMLTRDSGAESRSYFRMWDLLAEWLVSGEKHQELVIAPASEVFGRGSEVRLNGRVPPPDNDTSSSAGTLSLTVRKAGKSATADTVFSTQARIGQADGGFSIGVGRVEPGIYGYEAVYRGNGKEITAGGQFAVEAYSPELSVVEPDSAEVSRLVGSSKGKIYRPGAAAPGLLAGSVVESVSAGFRPSLAEWSYLVVVGLLAAEWALRRRKALS